jgi:hypothetical protein
MNAAEAFISRVISSASSPGGESFLVWEFTRLVGPVIGALAAEDLCRGTLDRLKGEKPPGEPRRLGYMAAFFLEEYDDPSMPLTGEDWREIRETLEDAAGDMPLDVLTVLMGELLSRGTLST